MILTTALVQAAESSGLTIGQILADIPRDGPAIFLYVITAASIGLILWAHRGKKGDDSADGGDASGT